MYKLLIMDQHDQLIGNINAKTAKEGVFQMCANVRNELAIKEKYNILLAAEGDSGVPLVLAEACEGKVTNTNPKLFSLLADEEGDDENLSD